MSAEDAPPGTVHGERAIPSVAKPPTVQSRVSTVLAAGLMSVLGIGMLTWYYTNTWARQGRARELAKAADAHRAQGDLPLPALGRIVPPVEAALVTSAEGPSPPAQPLRSVPVDSVVAQAAYGTPPPKTPAELAFERRLAGSAFVAQSGSAASVPVVSTTDATPVPLAPAGVATPVRAELLPTMRLLLPKGAFIDCTLETAIDSTLPGMTTCVTATDTFGVDGKVVLMERGTKLVGETKGQIQQGAPRVFVIWNEARTPAGVVVPLASPGADELGRAGLPGEVNRHFWERFGAAMLISIVDGAVQAGVQSSGAPGGPVVVNPATSQSVMTEVLKNTVNIPPTVVKAQGDRIQVLVSRDLDFRSVYALRQAGAEGSHAQ